MLSIYVNKASIHCMCARAKCQCYLCGSKKNIFSDVTNGTGGDTKAHTRKDVRVVSLTRVQCPPVM